MMVDFCHFQVIKYYILPCDADDTFPPQKRKWATSVIWYQPNGLRGTLGAYSCQSAFENKAIDGQDRKPYIFNFFQLRAQIIEWFILLFSPNVDTWKKDH